eukprot:CAMPEP_0171344900 /NCGR_PEP_ID=MMETSP0878-20121228/20421_1 /TAXON_ID=67004 /ORGANISM="Thalassiosira weissflogii, Strain CCMP1336" /LENGTH=521 /DNA_ID=CAMNT_0011848193 /DNA_START=152 /DNA_END=1717 /DNA_ORIENTATION=-
MRTLCLSFSPKSLSPLKQNHCRHAGKNPRDKPNKFKELCQFPSTSLLNSAPVDSNDVIKQPSFEDEHQKSPLSLTLNELSEKLGGTGRATAVWDCLRAGIDPSLYYAQKFDGDATSSSPDEGISDHAVLDAWIHANSMKSSAETILSQRYELVSDPVDRALPMRRQGQGLGISAWNKLQSVMKNYDLTNNTQNMIQPASRDKIFTIEDSIASLSHMTVSPDGTTKLLLKMARDGLEVESVIIPWLDKGFSTLCVSSQVGCRQGCTFCATGRMGKLRSLTADEILVQVYYASKICRISNSVPGSTIQQGLGSVDNIVFMGMGEAADNAEAVLLATNTLVDRRMFGLAQSKVTISTVAPDPEAFATLGQAPAVLAWSVHAVDDSLRKQLVPTTKYSMEELRNGLVKALSSRSNKLRRTMLEIALMEGVNDSKRDAELLAEFAQSIMNDVPGSKIVVNLIPFNDIGHPTYRTPSIERVLEFQKLVVEHGSANGRGVLCYVRTTRGDEESAACGQLATKKKASNT